MMLYSNPICLAILNTGWVGQKLSKRARQMGYDVFEGHHQAVDATQNKKKNLKQIQVVVSSSSVDSEIEMLFRADVLVITLPFKRHLQDVWEYANWFLHICQFLANSPVQHVIFTSSTSIYPKKNGMYTESSDLDSDSERARVLQHVETQLLDLPKKVCILRLAGLWGEDRKLTRKLLGPIEGPDVKMNLVHIEDVVSVIFAVIQHQLSGVYNICSPHHPNRWMYYHTLAKAYKMRPPVFINESKNPKLAGGFQAKNRLIQGQWICDCTGFQYAYPDILTCLKP